MRLAQIQALPEVMRESMKPVEKIGSIKIFDAGALMGAAPGGPVNGYGNGSFGDNLAGQLMRYQYGSPIIKALMDDAGFPGGQNGFDRLMRSAGGHTAQEQAPSAKPQPAPADTKAA